MLNIKIVTTNKYEKELKAMFERGKSLNKMLEVINLLLDNASKGMQLHLLLPAQYRLQKLSGQYNNRWECHIEPDWLLIFYLDDEKLILERTGTHADLF